LHLRWAEKFLFRKLHWNKQWGAIPSEWLFVTYFDVFMS
jgi:hypothetical protein